MLKAARLVLVKDLRLELRSRVATNQILPFAALILVVFAFAADADSALLERLAPGLFWVAILLTSLLAAGRAAAIEGSDGVPDALRLSGLDPAGVFLGKAGALLVVLLITEAALTVGIVVLYGTEIVQPVLFVTTAVAATLTLSGVGTLFGVMSLGLRVRETLLPLLIVPIAAPVVLAASRSHEVALGLSTGSGWPWVGLLAVIAVVYTGAGIAAYGPLLEEA